MAALDFPSASASPWVAPNGAIYTYIGTSPNGYWEANTANASQNLTDLFVEKSGSTMTGALKLDNAANVALPDICFDGDVNTGLYSSGADSLGLVCGGVQRLGIGSSGDVLIPGSLTSQSSTSSLNYVATSTGSPNVPQYRLNLLGAGMFSATGSDVSFCTNAVERFTIDSSGNAAFTHPVTSNASINVSHSSAASSSIQAFGVYAAGVNTSSIKTDGTALFGATVSLQGSGAQGSVNVDGDDLTFKTINPSGGAFQEGLRIIGGYGSGGVVIGGKDINTQSATIDSLQVGYALNLYEDSYSSGNNNYVVLAHNIKYNGANQYMRSEAASRMMQEGGNITFSNAAAGTAGNTVSLNERMRINSAGLVGIGTANPIDENAFGNSLNLNGPNGCSYVAKANNSSTNCGQFGYFGTTCYMINKAAGACAFYTTNAEHAQVSATGHFHASPAGAASYFGKGSAEFHSFDQATTAQWITGFRSQHASSPYGIVIQYSQASPNGTSNQFIYCSDTTSLKLSVKSNGGIENYSGNNTNLCDEREKKNIVSLEAKWDKVKNWELRKFHYNEDADTDDLRYGVIAQEVEIENPELITDFTKQRAEDAVLDEDGTVVTPAKEEILRKGVKEQQMMWMSIKALQEAMAKIETLEAKVAALEAD